MKKMLLWSTAALVAFGLAACDNRNAELNPGQIGSTETEIQEGPQEEQAGTIQEEDIHPEDMGQAGEAGTYGDPQDTADPGLTAEQPIEAPKEQ